MKVDKLTSKPLSKIDRVLEHAKMLNEWIETWFLKLYGPRVVLVDRLQPAHIVVRVGHLFVHIRHIEHVFVQKTKKRLQKQRKP